MGKTRDGIGLEDQRCAAVLYMPAGERGVTLRSDRNQIVRTMMAIAALLRFGP